MCVEQVAPVFRAVSFRRTAWLWAAGLASGLGFVQPGLADETPSLVLEPAPAGDRAAYVERAAVRGDKLVAARLAIDYAHAPLVLVDTEQQDDVVMANQTTFHLLASLSLKHRLLVALDVPFSYARGGSRSAPGSGAPKVVNGAQFGDIRLGARVRLYQSKENPDEGFTIGLASTLWFPTASEGYSGDGSVRVRGAFVAEGTNDRFFWGGNLGIRSRPAAVLPGILPTRVGSSIGLGLSGGFYADASRSIAIGTEFVGDFTVGADARFLDPRATTMHWLLTGHYRIAGGPFELGGAFGPGIGHGPGSSDVQVLFFLGRAPEQVEPPKDRDEDGVPDKLDACVSIKGVASSEPLLNGCPEAPADHDGDAIPDEYDACPRKAGVATFVPRTHGCPKIIDTDGDKVPDAQDACPNEKGVAPPDGDGCPKKPEPPQPPPTATVLDKEIIISQQVLFERGTAVIRSESDAILKDVARVFREHPEIELVEVQGHTDDTGDVNLNRQLGRDRAESVVKWLVNDGIARDRLSPKGYGADKPIDTNATDEGRAKNRRVEFHIVRRKTAESSPPTSGAAP